MEEEARPTPVAEYVRSYTRQSLETLQQIPQPEVVQFIELLRKTRDAGSQVFLCGNGGSATTASHLASELGKEASQRGPRRFRVLALTDNVSWITALANDLAYSEIFVEQLKNYGRRGDLLIAFSGSGNSANVVKAVEWANAEGLTTVGVVGRPGGRLGELAHHPVFVESSHMGHIQEGHFLIQHLVSYYFLETPSA